MNKNILTIIAVAIVVGAISFYGGMKYQSKKLPSLQNFSNMSQEQRQQIFQQSHGQNGSGQSGRSARTMGMGGFVGGEVISKDDKTITIKTPDGGSKIINYSDGTQISKPEPVQIQEITPGQQVTVTGTANNDNTITATSIQIRTSVSTSTPSGR